jgi:hypothetical protein
VPDIPISAARGPLPPFPFSAFKSPRNPRCLFLPFFLVHSITVLVHFLSALVCAYGVVLLVLFSTSLAKVATKISKLRVFF